MEGLMRVRCSRITRTAGLTVGLLTIVAGLGWAQTAPTRTLAGATTDTAGRPVPYVTVWFAGTRRTASDDSGRFRVSLPNEREVRVTFQRLGYRPFDLRLAAGSDTSVAIALVPVAARLAAQRIQAEQMQRSLQLHGFYERMAERQRVGSTGQFITPEEIDQRKPNLTTQLLDARNGVIVRRVGNCTENVRCWVPLGRSRCVMTMYLDGQRLSGDNGGLRHATGGLAGTAMAAITGGVTGDVVYLDEIIPPNAIAGIEIYERSVEAPPQYQLVNGSCGVILLWTK
jgi:Carboxypeptidase regulatory-like domain